MKPHIAAESIKGEIRTITIASQDDKKVVTSRDYTFNTSIDEADAARQAFAAFEAEFTEPTAITERVGKTATDFPEPVKVEPVVAEPAEPAA